MKNLMIELFKKERKEERGRGEGGMERGRQILGTEEQIHREKTHSFTQSFLVRSIYEMSVRL